MVHFVVFCYFMVVFIYVYGGEKWLFLYYNTDFYPLFCLVASFTVISVLAKNRISLYFVC